MADDTGEELINVAREILAKRGYLGLTMKTAAAAAGVTPDVAMRYYRNRDALVAAALRLPSDPISAIPTLVAPGVEGMGERLVRYMLDILRDQQTRDELVSLARTGVNAGHAMAGLQDFLERAIVDRMTSIIGVPDARMRSALITSYLLGVAMTRYGVRLEPLASASEEDVVRMVAPVIQDLLDPRKPLPGYGKSRSRTGSGASGAGQPASARPARTFDPDPKATAARAARGSSGSAKRPPAPPGGWPNSAAASAPHDRGPGAPRSAAPTPAAAPAAGPVPSAPPEKPRPAAAEPAPPGHPGTTPAAAREATTTGGSGTSARATSPTRPATASQASAAKGSTDSGAPSTAAKSASGSKSGTAKPATAKRTTTSKRTTATKRSTATKPSSQDATSARTTSTSQSSRSRTSSAAKAPKHAAPAPEGDG